MIDRRQLTLGGFGLAATALCPLFSRPARGNAATLPYVLFVYASGGWDPTMVFANHRDSGYLSPEPGQVAGVGAGGIPFVDHPNRPNVRSFMETYGQAMAIVNGISVGAMDRHTGLRNVLGFTPTNRARPVDWLSYFVASLNPVLDIPHAVLDAPYMPGDYAGVAVRLNKRVASEHITAPVGVDPLGDEGEAALATFRQSAYGEFYKGVAPLSLDGEKLRALYYGYAREPAIAGRLIQVESLLGAQGADSDFLRQGKTAIELFAGGASQCATIQAGRTDLWNSATNHFAEQTTNYETLFADLKKIFQHAESRDVLSRMLVVVVSERGRAPRLNAAGGKGPWPYTSAMLWGMGIRGGTVFSAFDAALRGLPVNPLFGGTEGGTVTLTMAHVFAALYLLYNVPYQLVMPGTQPLTPILAEST